MMADNRTVQEKLSAKKIITPAGCWEWQGTKHSWGYGVIKINQQRYLVHRVAAWLWKGMPLDSPLKVCHHCDNPPCFNPEHLFLGTDLDNILDAVRKGRWKPAIGEMVSTAKLNEEKVREIRRLHSLGMSFMALSKQYGVHHSAISPIVRRTAWKHVL